MKNKRRVELVVVPLVVCVLTNIAYARQSATPKPLETSREIPEIVTLAPVQSAPVNPPAVPPQVGGWTVEVVTTGGIMGGTRRVVLDSAGAITCPSSCLATMGPDALRTVTSYVRNAADAAWSRGEPVASVSVCRDCQTTHLSLWRREADGTIRLFHTQWDPTTAGSIDPAVLQLREQIVSAVRQ